MTARSCYLRLVEPPGGGDPFDRHVLACALAVAWTESPAGVAEGLGLAPAALARLVAAHFPQAADLITGDGEPPAGLEEPDLRALLLAQRTDTRPEQDWLARIVARRCLRPNHLWQDLGLGGRDELSRLMRRHFAPLAAANDRDMKWKKFLYRRLCQDEGILICKSPVCESCTDFALCFGPEECPVPDTGKPE